jgi:hypothetical protein
MLLNWLRRGLKSSRPLAKRPRRNCPRVEILEDRWMPSVFGTNLVVNGNAEAGPGATGTDTVSNIPGWTPSGNFTVHQYGDTNYLTATDPGPDDRGQNFFAGGPGNSSSSASQMIDVSAGASTIDTGSVSFSLSAYLGGWQDQRDNAVLTATFLDGHGATLGTSSIGPVTASDRNSARGLLSRGSTGTLPAGTRSVQLVLQMTRLDGSYDDGYADDVSLVLTPQTASPVRTLVYNQITSVDMSDSHDYKLSANGSRAVYTQRTYTPYTGHLYVVDADGAGAPREVASIPTYNGYFGADISADGHWVIGRDWVKIDAVNPDVPGSLHTLVQLSDIALGETHISGDGKTVVFIVTSDVYLAGTSTPVPRGIWAINTDGTNLRQVVSAAAVASVLGIPENAVSIFWYQGNGLGISDDGSHIVFSSQDFNGQPNASFWAVTLDNPASLHRLVTTGVSPFRTYSRVGISGDGRTAFYEAADPAGVEEIGVIPFDSTNGTGRRVLYTGNSLPGDLGNTPGSGANFMLSTDGSKLLLGDAGALMNTADGSLVELAATFGGFSSDPRPLFSATLFGASMNGTATRFLYYTGANGGQLATLDIDPESLGAAPSVTDPLLSRPYLLSVNNPPVTVTARVKAPGTILRVSNATLRDGASYFGEILPYVMFDDGRTDGDQTAGDHIFTTNQYGPRSNGIPLGPRTVRVQAENQTADGRYHGTAVEFGGLKVVTDAPTSPTSSVNPLPAYTASTSIPVSWSGSDAGGPGIASYDVYVSDNGGPFVPFQTGTTATSATFAGQDGHTYGFYSVATDKGGARQPTPSGAQATTLVDVMPPTSAVGALPAFTRTTSFTVSWSGGDGPHGSGIAAYDILYTDNGGAPQAFLTHTTQTSATFGGQDGHTYGFYSVATDNAGNVEAPPGPAQGTAVVLAGNHLVIHAPSQAVAGGTLPVTVNVVNADGFTDPLWQGSVALSVLTGPAGGWLTGTTVAAVHNGVATLANLSLNAVGSYQLLASSTGILVAGVSAPITVGAPQKFAVAGTPAAATAGTSFTFSVTALTAAGLTNTGYLGTIHFTSSDPQAVLPPDTTFAAGDHGKKTFTVTLKTAGGQTINVADVNGGVVSGKSPAVPVAAAAASKLQVAGYPTPDVAGVAHSFVVTALDPFGNVAPTYRGKVQFGTGDSAALLPPAYTFVAADQGHHPFSATYATAGTWSLAAGDLARPGINGSEANITVLSLTAGVSGPASGLRGQPLTFTLTGAETGTPAGTVFTYKIDWDGNGTVDQTVTGPTGTTVVHVFPAAGGNTVKVLAVDGAGNVSPPAAQAITVRALALQPDPADGTKTALAIEGTTGDDVITISPADPTGTTVSVTINGVAQPGGPFALTGHILVYGQAGNDTIQEVAKAFGGKTATVAVPAVLFAGAGNVTLSAVGSSANNVLVGGGGKDSLTGGSGRDILIGGAGASTLRAGSGGDILVAGRTAYDADVAALLAVVAEWGRTDRGYSARVSDLFGTGTGGLNGTARLTPQTVTVAAGADQLFAGLGPDWLWIAASPRATDQVNSFGPGDIVTFE